MFTQTLRLAILLAAIAIATPASAQHGSYFGQYNIAGIERGGLIIPPANCGRGITQHQAESLWGGYCTESCLFQNNGSQAGGGFGGGSCGDFGGGSFGYPTGGGGCGGGGGCLGGKGGGCKLHQAIHGGRGLPTAAILDLVAACKLHQAIHGGRSQFGRSFRSGLCGQLRLWILWRRQKLWLQTTPSHSRWTRFGWSQFGRSLRSGLCRQLRLWILWRRQRLWLQTTPSHPRWTRFGWSQFGWSLRSGLCRQLRLWVLWRRSPLGWMQAEKLDVGLQTIRRRMLQVQAQCPSLRYQRSLF